MRTIRKTHMWLVACIMGAACAIVAARYPFCALALAEPGESHDDGNHALQNQDRVAHNDDAHDENAHDDDAHDDDAHDEDTHAGHAPAELGQAEGGHDGHGDEEILRLSDRDRLDIGIKTAVAGPGKLNIRTRLPGKVRINEDLLAHVVPLVSGIAVKVNRRVGDQVRKGDVLAVIASRSLAEFRAAFLTARARRDLAVAAFEREKQLWQKKISSEQDYLDAGQTLAEAEIEVLAAEQSLHALGISEEDLKQLGTTHDASLLTRFDIRASLDGTIIAKHITRGEKVGEDADVFAIACLDTVWVDLNVPQKDLDSIQKHQKVTISAAGMKLADVAGEIGFVSPIIDEETRTAVARVVIPNTDGAWRPGLFVTAVLTTEQLDAAVLVPNEAIQILAGESVVFVPDEGGFKSVAVAPGRSDGTRTEIVAGLRPGQEYVTRGAFELKAEVVTSGLDAHAGHGH